MPHLFVDISSHGFGHLAQTAPILNRLVRHLPGLHLTVRSGLPAAKLRQRIEPSFTHLPVASDFGFRMLDALRVDRAASASAYHAAHQNHAARIDSEARFLQSLCVDAVFANVAYLPLAGAAQAGLPALAMCSLNWADLFLHFFGDEPWAATIHAEIAAAYRTAPFLRITPGMPMPSLDHAVDIGPIAAAGTQRRDELCRKIGAGDTARLVLVAMGGIPTALPVERWPSCPGTHWLISSSIRSKRPDLHDADAFGWHFADLMRSVDAIVTKPGYGTFAEAVCNDTAVIYLRREDWPEQDSLIDWLHCHGRCAEIGADDIASDRLVATLNVALTRTAAAPATFFGIDEATERLVALLTQ